MPYPSKRTPEIEAEVLSRMSKGETLTSICRSLGISTNSWSVWCREDEVLDIAHGHARDEGFDAIAADCLKIADTPLEGVSTESELLPDLECSGEEKKLTMQITKEKRDDMLGHRKLQIETRLKLLAKWDPRRYGDKLDIGGKLDLGLEALISQSMAITKPDDTSSR